MPSSSSHPRSGPRATAVIAQVPRGRVTTPGALAAALGNPIAARWIGHYLLHHDHDANCFVIALCGLAACWGPIRRASDEKVPAAAGGGSRDWLPESWISTAIRLRRIHGRSPSEELAHYQNRVAAQVSLRSARKVPRYVGGVDVSYVSPHEGVAAYALVEVATGELLWSTTIRRAVRFPYISSYLTFRELPLLIELIDEVRARDRIAPVILVDGTGILHPRRAGIACHLGVVTGLPTIGVTKKLLCGQVDIDGLQPLESRPVVLDDQLIGAAIRPTSGSRRPLFISPGSGVNLASAEADCPSGPHRTTVAVAPLLGGSFKSQTCENLAIKTKLFCVRWKSAELADSSVDDRAV